MNILTTQEEVGTLISSDWVDSLMLDNSSIPFKKLLHVVDITGIKVALLKLIRDNERRVFVSLLHCQSKLRGSAPILKSLENLLKSIDELALSTVRSTIAKYSSTLSVMLL